MSPFFDALPYQKESKDHKTVSNRLCWYDLICKELFELSYQAVRLPGFDVFHLRQLDVGEDTRIRDEFPLMSPMYKQTCDTPAERLPPLTCSFSRSIHVDLKSAKVQLKSKASFRS